MSEPQDGATTVEGDVVIFNNSDVSKSQELEPKTNETDVNTDTEKKNIPSQPDGEAADSAEKNNAAEKAAKTRQTLNGTHCFILESGAKIEHLTIYRDSMESSTVQPVYPHSPNGMPPQVRRFGTLPRNSRPDYSAFKEEDTQSEGTASAPAREIEYAAEYPKQLESDDMHDKISTRDQLEPGLNLHQLRYNSYMETFPGLDTHRYHVDHYVNTKIYKQDRSGNQTEPINLEHLYTSEDGNTDLPIDSVLLVADCGKTAFCLNVLHKYAAHKSCFNAFPSSSSLLFLVSLSNLMSQLNDYRSRIRGKRLLLVVDEYNPKNKPEKHALEDILSRKHQVYDMGATSVSILLTTKPFENDHVLESFDRRVKLGGFGEHEVEEFVRILVKEPDAAVLLGKIKEVVGDLTNEISPLVLLTLCLSLQMKDDLSREEILESCQDFIALRLQQKAQNRTANFFGKILRMNRLLQSNKKLKSKHSKEAANILEKNGLTQDNN